VGHDRSAASGGHGAYFEVSHITSGPESWFERFSSRIICGKTVQYLSASDDLRIHNDIVI
jgi:hypothetical protein